MLFGWSQVEILLWWSSEQLNFPVNSLLILFQLRESNAQLSIIKDYRYKFSNIVFGVMYRFVVGLSRSCCALHFLLVLTVSVSLLSYQDGHMTVCGKLSYLLIKLVYSSNLNAKYASNLSVCAERWSQVKSNKEKRRQKDVYMYQKTWCQSVRDIRRND